MITIIITYNSREVKIYDASIYKTIGAAINEYNKSMTGNILFDAGNGRFINTRNVCDASFRIESDKEVDERIKKHIKILKDSGVNVIEI